MAKKLRDVTTKSDANLKYLEFLAGLKPRDEPDRSRVSWGKQKPIIPKEKVETSKKLSAVSE
jgi:hypothetical protein